MGDRGRRAEAQAVAQAPDDGAGHDVERGERAVAAGEVDEAAGALHARSGARRVASAAARAAPGPAPAGLAAREVDGDEVVLALGDDDELAGGPGRWTTAPATGPPTRGARRARSVISPLPKSWTAERAVGSEARDAARA